MGRQAKGGKSKPPLDRPMLHTSPLAAQARSEATHQVRMVTA